MKWVTAKQQPKELVSPKRSLPRLANPEGTHVAGRKTQYWS